MRKIYLASGSKARKELFKLFGLRFKVLKTAVKEQRGPEGLSYAGLVKKNALRKAKAAARAVSDGIIVAADTVTVGNHKIFGKPGNLTEARNMLKRLSSSPQLVYTGIAVIDKDNDKTLVSYEKTRVYMDKLSDKEISGYFRKVSPLGKAGSFDIQGRGAFFIRRIEGCFYNVVGLPIRKLYHMFRELGVKIFLVCLFACLPACLFLAGCSTEYNIVTGKEELFYYSTDKEVKMGRAIAGEIENKYKLVDDPLIQERVQDIGKKIVEVCDRKDIDYHFMALDDNEDANAFALPGGYVYVNKALVDSVANDDELAVVLGHEVGHIVARHSIKKLQAIMGYSLLRILAVAVPEGGQVGNAADLAFAEILLGYGRDDELLADQLASRYAKSAGFNPRAMIDFLQKLQEINRRKPLRPKSYFKTHPYIPDRIRIVKQELGEGIDFKDYINIEETQDN